MTRIPCDQCAATGETREASAPIGREEWCRRFVAELTRLADGAAYCPMSMQPLAEYAEEAAEAWFEDSDGLTPETCAAIEKDMLQ